MWNAMGNDGNSWQHSKEKKYSFEPINKNITITPIRADSYLVKYPLTPEKTSSRCWVFTFLLWVWESTKFKVAKAQADHYHAHVCQFKVISNWYKFFFTRFLFKANK